MSHSPDLNRLRARIAALEGWAPALKAQDSAIPLGVDEIDSILPWVGLPWGMVHEIAPARLDRFGDGAVRGFAAYLLARLTKARGRPGLWITEHSLPYGPGLASFGLTSKRLILVRGGRPTRLLWAIEEATRNAGPAAVLGEVRNLDFTEARRLALAARASGTCLLLLNRGNETVRTTSTRWRIGPSRAAPEAGFESWRWHVELCFCRGRGVNAEGHVAAWEVEWDDAAHHLRLAADSGDRQTGTPTSRVA